MAVTFEVDDREVVRMLRGAEEALEGLLERVAEMVEEEAEAESRSRGVTWRVRRSPDLAVEVEQWWAHFLARGTRAHGPVASQRLLLRVDGRWVSPVRVAGIATDPFHERAVQRARSRVDEVLAEAVRGAV